MNAIEIQQEALSRATNQLGSTMNFGPIIEGFMAKGIPADQIEPRVNVFTFHAWKALGRSVKKGEHGVKVTTFVPMTVKDRNDPSKKISKCRPWTTTVFHVSQTQPIA